MNPKPFETAYVDSPCLICTQRHVTSLSIQGHLTLIISSCIQLRKVFVAETSCEH